MKPTEEEVEVTKKTTSTQNIINIPKFDPTTLIGKVSYELNNENIANWQNFIRGILRFYNLEDWLCNEVRFRSPGCYRQVNNK